MSETASARPYLERFCVGRGLDIGFGGDPIKPDAITVDKNPDFSPTVVCDAAKLPFPDNNFDYVYSSHCLEDFEDTKAVLKEWLRVLKPGGNMVLFLPEQEDYIAHCQEHSVLPNLDHKHDRFGFLYVVRCFFKVGVGTVAIYYEEAPTTYNPYSFALVCRKI